MSSAFSIVDDDIYDQKNNITEIHFISMEQSEIDTIFETSTIKKDVTDTTKSDNGSVKAGLEADTIDTTEYIMYVASNGTIIFHNYCNSLFANFTNLINISFENIDTSQVTTMGYMFAGCTNLTTIYVNDNWNTTKMKASQSMFGGCEKLLGAAPYYASKVDITMANSTTGYFTRKEV